MTLPSPSSSWSCALISRLEARPQAAGARLGVGLRRPSDVTPALAADADLRAVAVEAVADARRRRTSCTTMRDVRDVDRHLLVDDAALHRRAASASGGASTMLTPVVRSPCRAPGSTRVIVPRLPMSLPDEHDDLVALLQLHRHNTSGASDTIRMNLRSRSSRPTGPKMRVPRGCIWSLISTAAFSSKRM